MPKAPSIKALLAERRISLVIGASLSVLLGLALLRLEPGEGLVNLSYDLSSVMLPSITPEQVTIVYMDEEAHQTLSQPWGVMWDRSLHARLLDRLREDGAKLAVFDVFFADPGIQHSNDIRLAEAIKAFGRVVLAADRVRVHDPSVRTVEQTVAPLDLFRNAARTWGIARLDTGADYGVRQHFAGTEVTPSLAWAALELVRCPLTQQPSAAEPHPGLKASERAPVRLRERWLRYYGPEGAIPAVSYARALDAPRSFFEGRIVFIGGKPQTRFLSEERESYITPYTRWNHQSTSGVEIHATTFLNLLRGDWLRRLASPLEDLIVIALGLLFGSGLRLVSPIGTALGAAAGAVGMTFAAWILAAYGLLWFPWMIVVAVQIPCGLLCAVVARAADAPQGRFEPRPDRISGPAPSQIVARPLHLRTHETHQPPSKTELDSVGEHMLIRRIGHGAYGEVWLARNQVGLYRAVKLIYRDRFASVDPYEREFEGVKNFMGISMKHPGFLKIMHVGRDEERGFFFYVMEAADDEISVQKIDPSNYNPRTLSGEVKRRGALSPEECHSLMLDLTAALEELHRLQFVHRDLKPSNIIFVEGYPKLGDIGLVATISEPGQMTLVGTPGYIAPEGSGQPASDLYSLGKILYVALTQQTPDLFPRRPSNVAFHAGSGLAEGLRRIMLRACQTDVQSRYGSAAEMRADLISLKTQLDRGDAPTQLDR